ncbi:Uu.00g110690.m01.CDS01 [Anthostomella pinea]|uniref:Uu.00g110690.m01.CDS01 n=1 Tax=Anthostomella pinea TaxID=933095 RepID=A0AAI8YGA9_9PEZI|nr:Uu.00g110690.m01.CDS01 [Anthostomella pinea]
MRVFPIVNKARKPKFELHLSIYDLNNVPLVAGTSIVKWHLPASIHGEHRGRTGKCSIDKINHRVSYNYSKIIPLRISIDRANNLTECPIEFEVLQEFPMVPSGRDEKISLGTVKLNLSEYVEESENFPRRSTTSTRGRGSLEHARDKVMGHNSSQSHGRLDSRSAVAETPISPTNTTAAAPQLEENDVVDEEAEEGIVRRYLMQESKINSTLKIGILMVQVDGERNYVAPPLKTAPIFGGIAGIMTSDPLGDQDDGSNSGMAGSALPSLNKSRDASELQDMYRRSLAASWACQPGELPADECIEDIFSGGSGWRDKHRGATNNNMSRKKSSQSRRSDTESPDSNITSNSASGDEAAGGTLRPSDMRRMRTHLRSRSTASDKSTSTLTTTGGGGARNNSYNVTHTTSNNNYSSYDGTGDNGNGNNAHPNQSGHRRQLSGRSARSGKSGYSSHLNVPNINGRGEDGDRHAPSEELSDEFGMRIRSESLGSLAPTIGSSTSSERERGREGFRRPKEVDEYELRDDLVAWKLPEIVR